MHKSTRSVSINKLESEYVHVYVNSVTRQGEVNDTMITWYWLVDVTSRALYIGRTWDWDRGWVQNGDGNRRAC